MRKEKKMDKIWPANYLTVDNVARYRKIMRFFYEKHHQFQGGLYRADVLEMMRREFSSDYSDLEVNGDLDNLVEWGNLKRQQEMVRPKSIEDYRNKHFRYQISEEGIIVEEMAYKLTHIKRAAQGSLDKESFDHLLELFNEFIKTSTSQAEIWLKIREEFKSISDNTANYITYITSPEVDSRMKTEQFLIYKDKFVNYLRDFVSSVQQLYYQLRAAVEEISTMDSEPMIESLYQKELEKPQFDEIKKSEIAEQVRGEITAIYNWFIGSSARSSEYDSLMRQTEQMISKITGLIYYFGQEMHQYRSRKKDYIKIAEWLNQAETIPEAQKMYAGIFGLEHTRHYYIPEVSEATSTKEDSWELLPAKLHLGQRGRGRTTETRARAFSIDSQKQYEQMATYLKQETKRKERVLSYFKDDFLDFEKIQTLDSVSRQIFLRWISSSLATASEYIMTEFDFSVTIHLEKEHRINVSCEDGVLEMPAVTMKKGVSA